MGADATQTHKDDRKSEDLVVQRAAAVVSCIQHFIDTVRTCFPTVQTKPTGACNEVSKQAVSRTVATNQEPERTNLLSALQDSSNDGTCLAGVQDMRQRHQMDSTQQRQTDCDERCVMISNFVHPILQELYDCYAALDERIRSAPTQHEPRNGKIKQIGKRNRPAPPPGMLSIQNYTDVACLLEFLVCTSILPNLEQHILTTAKDRITSFLPKSLAGRIPRAALYWGSQRSTISDEWRREELRASTLLLGNIVLLDRFRPMLLPRHLPDLIAALLQLNQLMMATNQSESPIGLLELQQACGVDDDNSENGINHQHRPKPAPVPVILRVKAFQTLLQHGRKAPKWLKQSISKHLDHVACADLTSLLLVFCPPTGTNENTATSASQRLGKSLAQSATAWHQRRQQRFCEQLLGVSEMAIDDVGKAQNTKVAAIQTVWAALLNSSESWIATNFACVVLNNLIGTGDVISDTSIAEAIAQTNISTAPSTTARSEGSILIHRTIRALCGLFSFVPPLINVQKVCQGLCFTQSQHGGGTVITQLLQLASTTAALKSTAKEEAKYALRAIAHITCTQASFQTIADADAIAKGNCVMALSFIYATSRAVTVHHDGGNASNGVHARIQYNITPADTRNTLDTITVTKSRRMNSEGNGVGMGYSDGAQEIEDLTNRTAVIMDGIIRPMLAHKLQPTPASSMDDSQSEIRNLPHEMLRISLGLYLFGTSTSLRNQVDPKLLHPLRLAALAVLPVLCEKLSFDEIIVGDNADGSGILSTLLLILFNAYKHMAAPKQAVGQQSTADGTEKLQRAATSASFDFVDDLVNFLKIMKLSTSLVINNNGNSSSNNNNNGSIGADDENDDETLVSILSTVLSILITILEGGSGKRSNAEEELLKMFPNVLLPFVDVAAFSKSSDVWKLAAPSLADMASHGIALLAARQADGSSDDITSDVASSDNDDEIITFARVRGDLQSEQPPIRARGVVTLGRMVRAKLWSEPSKEQPKIQIIGREEENADGDEFEAMLHTCLELATRALNDSESYVYLAAIQTIAVLADSRPKVILPKLAYMIVTGMVEPTTSSTSTPEQLHPETAIVLKPEQRIKLAESLIFSIRRRASTMEFFPLILEMMVYGGSDRIGSSDMNGDLREGEKKLIAVETHEYFLGETKTDSSGDAGDDAHATSLEEKKMRIHTGGPVFAVEEADMVAAARLNVVSELLAASAPAALSPYCALLVDTVKSCLLLTDRRQLSRSAAALARDLYQAVQQEQVVLEAALSESARIDDSMVRFSTSFVAADEESLFHVVRAVASGKSADRGPMDPATTSRCTEAIEVRRSVKRDGMLDVANAVFGTSQKRGNILNIVERS